jgi:hypothetical protein
LQATPRDQLDLGLHDEYIAQLGPRGAKVFAAGAFTLAGSALQPTVGRLIVNLWLHLAGSSTA